MTREVAPLPTWKERTGGWEQKDEMGRIIRVQVSRFHGPMVSVDGHTSYLGDEGAASLIEYLEGARGGRA